MAAKAQARGKKKPRSAVKTAQRMSGFDFATWRTGSDDPVMRSTIMGLLVLDRAPDWKTLVERFDRSSRTNAALRQKVIDQGGLTTPRLIIDNDFDLSFHLRRFRMPEGSDWADVLEDARRQSMTDFDKDRPLWRTTVLEGLPGGRAAIIIKIHHAIADGQGAVMLGASLFDFTADGMDLGQMPEAPIGETLDRAGFVEVVIRDRFGWMARSTQDFVRGVGPLTLTALRDPSDTITRISRTAKSLARFTKVPLGPLSPLMVERSINYTFGTIDLPFADIKAAGKQANHTANDVFMAAVANGMGKYHISLGQPVKKLRVNMPISTRTDSSGTSNAVNIARFELPISVKQTKRLMDQISETVTAIRHEPALAFANELGEISRFIPSDIVAAAAQASDVTVSNVPGVPVPVWLAGAQVEAMYPLVATIGAAVNVTMLTYNGNASIGISCDDAAVPDVDLLVSCLREGFADVLEKPVEATTPIGDVLAEKQTSDDEPRKTMSTPEKGAREMAPAKKTAAKKSAAKKTAAKKAPAKKATAKKTVAKKAPAKKAPAKKAPAKKAPAKKAPAKKAPAKKAPAKKAPAKKAPAKKAPAKKAPAKKAPAKKAPAKKAPAKKARR